MICDPTIEEAVLDLVKRRTAHLTTAEERVYLEGQVPQSTPQQPTPRPFISIELFSDVPEHTTDGPVGLTRATVAITAHAERQSEATQIGQVIVRRVDNSRGLYGGVYLSAVTRMNRQNPPGTAPDGREFGLKRTQVDFEIWYQERIAVDSPIV